MSEISALLDSAPVLFAGVALLFGLLVGSFLNVVIHRLPKMMEADWREQCAQLDERELPAREKYNLVAPRSACPECGHKITALQNIPILSYLLLRGRCAGCQTKISSRYPAVEALTGIATAVVAYRFGFGAEALAGIALTWGLIALSGIDIDHKLLPDSITMPLLWLGLLLSLWHGSVDADTLFIEPRQAIIGAVAGYLSLWLVFHAFRLATGKIGMGYGDFKLLAVLGAWLGWQSLPLVIILSAAVGALFGIALIVFRKHGRDIPIPFGPYLAAAGWVALLWGKQLIDQYLHVSGLR